MTNLSSNEVVTINLLIHPLVIVHDSWLTAKRGPRARPKAVAVGGLGLGGGRSRLFSWCSLCDEIGLPPRLPPFVDETAYGGN